MSQRSVDTVVFGSGLAGMACARRLALEGQSVCVIEKNREPGGHLLPFERRGVTFEVGLHYLAATEPGGQFSRACWALQIAPEIVPLDAIFDELRSPSSPPVLLSGPVPRFARHLAGRFENELPALERYRKAVERVWRLVNRLRFPVTVGSLLRGALSEPELVELLPLAAQSVDTFFERHVGASQRLIDVLSCHHMLIGVAPERMSALVYLAAHAYYFHGACFIKGGGRALLQRLLHSRVDLRTGQTARIDALRDAGNGARFRIESARDALLCRNVVWSPDPRLLRHHSNIRLGPLRRHLLRYTEYPHAYVVGYFATREPLRHYGLGNRNYYLMGSLGRNEAYCTRDLEQLARQAPLFVSTGSLRDPGSVPDHNALGAKGALQVMFLCPPDPELWGIDKSNAYRKSRGVRQRYVKQKARLLDLLRARLVAEFPRLRDDFVWQELGTPLTHGRYLHAPGLGGLGYAPTVADQLLYRPSYQTGVPGLYWCSQYIRPAHGIATALGNGVGVAERIIEHAS